VNTNSLTYLLTYFLTAAFVCLVIAYCAEALKTVTQKRLKLCLEISE